ncbi:hypothetical protein [Mucilaginibacter sp. OK098]|uniref:hypothetical protein n=1 Tax=Mucilaginibacter sp. OK098 TaxID=1855297 RepID=UPI0009137ADE|nr:hypothetical protein [Mucilaginibacter sp. OK098]SHM80517.1 hypothetical protein SAMN05216524_103471 [Mucilaginibacter sp. OK098]
MEHLPIYISIVFMLTTLLAIGLLYKAANHSKFVLIAAILWLALQAIVGLSGFYTVTNVIPPRFPLLLMPPVVFIAALFIIKKGRLFMDGFDVKTLTLLHIVRIPVELTLYLLFLHKLVPGIITFEGRNFDILCGLTAPIVYYFGYIKNVLNKKIIIGWNIICLLFLANVVITAVLSAPFPFQKFGFDQPNIALFYFPFIWLPCFIVPAVLFAHLVSLRKLIK